MLEIREPDAHYDCAEERIVGVVNPPTENDDLQSLYAVEKRIADVNALIVVGL